ncbi:tight adherence protein TadE [Sphingobium sp. SCG-1]|uniref:TadE/TadG family type IV pilus assembly protein n=1 Tax=Sphingobium sp. SCG-1 TaxID=2072936 RepID=UPI000CD6996B|nr:TadE/TadG family type IV pilus assembly protein [Sphingobium sp. SCG-1]AUW59123.1 tight adherence protein TadE [Sphingobium sp. SCG-1]
MIAQRLTQRARCTLQRLRDDRSGLALIEFALVTPIMLVLITGGVELANYSITSMRLSALALQVADNASRIGSGDPLAAKKITEAQVNDLLQGALAQGGNMNINGTYSEKQVSGSNVNKNKARIVISSLEPDTHTAHVGRNYIHWQRCYGRATEYTPQYGLEGVDNITGMGPTGRQVFAPAGTAVIFVEVHYRYEPLFPLIRPDMFGMMTYKDMNSVAAMVVRDDRDLSQIYPVAGVTASTC